MERWIQWLHMLCAMNMLCKVSAIAVGKGTESVSSTIKSPIASKHQVSSLLDPWREFEEIRDTDLEEEYLTPFFQKRPTMISQRMLDVSQTLYRARGEWMSSADPEKADGYETYCEEGGPANLDGRDLDEDDLERAIKLCTAVASLGPVATKIGQTLSQRPDLVGASAAKALKRLQTKNTPFENKLAYSVIHESLDYWEGPLAPGIQLNNPNVDPDGPPLFAKMTKDCIACASLGQVYRATMHDGTEVAVKVQRPDGLALLAKDAQCFRLVFQARANVEKVKSFFSKSNPGGQTEAEIREKGRDDSSVGGVIDRVARDVKKELDYKIEAKNSVRFRESLNFLGFVTTPDVIQATSRILITEWIPGRHLEYLSKDEGLAMTRMAVEACTASICLTGYVHADPHEGNLMLHDDGRIVFLDFGLMSEVSVNVMEGFARGIQGLLSDNFVALTESFVDVNFITSPINHRMGPDDVWREDPNYGLPELAEELEAAMLNTDGGVSQFGALATVLNKEISPKWLVFTPPYVILLCRTFLTLEGIAQSVDPEFNIYEISMPWAVRRSLSPSTQKGIDVFRSTLLTEENKIQWQRLLDLAKMSNEGNDTTVHVVAEQISDIEAKEAIEAQRKVAMKAAMEDAVGTLLGSSDGRALRRVLKDLDSADLISKLSSRDGRPLLKTAVAQASNRLFSKTSPLKLQESKSVPIENIRPISEECVQLRMRQSRWNKRIKRHLITHHMKLCLLQWKGLKATTKFVFVFAKVFLSTLLKRIRGANEMDRDELAVASP